MLRHAVCGLLGQPWAVAVTAYTNEDQTSWRCESKRQAPSYAIGAALAMVAYLGGPISGGNYNPAVTLMMVLSRKQPLNTLFTYMIVQFLAAFTVTELYKRLM